MSSIYQVKQTAEDDAAETRKKQEEDDKMIAEAHSSYPLNYPRPNNVLKE